MADDASYNNFLNKANEPTGARPSESSSSQPPSTSEIRSNFDPTEKKSSLPPSIANVLESRPTYTSDTDTHFDSVLFSYSSGDLPSASEFSQVLTSCHVVHGQVESLEVAEFDGRKQYESITNAVSAAGNGKVRVYRVEKETQTRVEYFVLTVDKDGRKLVGVRVQAVES